MISFAPPQSGVAAVAAEDDRIGALPPATSVAGLTATPANFAVRPVDPTATRVSSSAGGSGVGLLVTLGLLVVLLYLASRKW